MTDLVEHFDYKPATPVDEGVANFVAWYRDYFKV
jgi:UDP-glucuronate 4-epimerase